MLISEKYLKNKYIKIEDTEYCVYFITDGEYIKIGMAASLPNRVKQLQVGNARKLKVLYIIPANNQKEALGIEKMFHNYFKELNVSGEWFKLSEDKIRDGCMSKGYYPYKAISKFNFEIDGIAIV